MRRVQTKQPGQAIVVLVIFGTLLFAFIGLGIDSGMLYLERRHLQNIADAACLAASTELALGGTEAEARTAANDYIVSNLNANARAAFELPTPINSTTVNFITTGAPQGVNLTSGIEVDGSDVRVAVTFPAYTYFLRIVGLETYNVMARTRCHPTKGGGILPIAVVRYPGYDQTGNNRIGVANTSDPLPQKYGNRRRPKNLVVRDILQQSQHNEGRISDGAALDTSLSPYWGTGSCMGTAARKRNWYDWDGVGLGTPSNYIVTPNVEGTGPYRNLTADCRADDASVGTKGYEVVMVGNGASPNIGDPSFTGLVMLDVRDIGTTSPKTLNGWTGTTSTNEAKDRAELYIRTQYPGPDVTPGQQVGLLSGVNAGNLIDAIQDRYSEGEEVITVVYNGQVYKKGDFQLSITCVQNIAGANPGCDNTGSNEGSYVARPAPPSSNLVTFDTTSGTCKYSGEYYIASGTVASGTFGAANLTAPFVPAKYNVRLEAVAGTGTNQVKLSARLSGRNELVGTNSRGNPEGYGDMKVRWIWTDGSPTVTHTTPWQNPNAEITVAMPASGAINVLLEVVQTAWNTTGVTCTGAPVATTVQVPTRVSGAQTIQVTAREVSQGTQHSVYGALGMRANPTGSSFDSNDYFMTFLNEPVADIRSTEDTTIAPQLELVRANSSTGAEIDRADISADVLTWDVTWYKDNVRLIGEPAGLHAELGLTGPGQPPRLTIVQTGSTGSVVSGLYSIDIETEGDEGSPRLHSNRFNLRVQDGLNASIDSWIVALCYAKFELTDLGDPNSIMGRATSGCQNPKDIYEALTSRLLPWAP